MLRTNILNYKIAGDNAPYLHLSLRALNDCALRAAKLRLSGVRYLNASSEMFGIKSSSYATA
ncbi:hypothetical protein [Hominenteromicrobium sp.]|uniref:hypothetical protein n=1 Tax=Hominenteromicrobium sp. TaxID=3073581 RepID=UPI0039994A1B